MNIPAVALQFIPVVLSFLGPHLIAILNDPRPGRAWLRVLVTIFVVCLESAIQVLMTGTWSWAAFGQSVIPLLTGSTTFYVLLKKAYLGSLEVKTGTGIGGLFDIKRRPAEPSVDEALAVFSATKQRLDKFLAAGAITQEVYQEKFAEAQRLLVGGTGETDQWGKS